MRFSRLRSTDMSEITDRQARETLERYQGLLLHLVRKIKLPAACSVTEDDLLQIARIEAVQSLTNHEPASSSEASWIARHVWQALCRVSRDIRHTVPRAAGYDLAWAVDPAPGPSAILEAEERSEWLERAARGLTAPEHVAVFAEDGAACKILEVSRQRANQLRHSAIAKLKRAAARDRMAA